jgi:hypothetical protein
MGRFGARVEDKVSSPTGRFGRSEERKKSRFPTSKAQEEKIELAEVNEKSLLREVAQMGLKSAKSKPQLIQQLQR